ncbi:MAG: phosphotransferase [Chloroflexi bacterium]|nr:phosphotransferase [Chloroflexota bacterium]
MNRNLEQPLALGRTAELYAWDKGRVLKLFHNWFELENIQYEQHMAQAVHDSGLPVPANTLRPDLPPQRRRLENKLGSANPLPAFLKTAALTALEALPDGDRICHGDFHPGNILLTPARAVVIDWIDASLGNPLADVARTTIIALGAAASSQIPDRAMKSFVKLFHSIYLRHYFQLRPGGEAEYRRWLPVVAAARLSENIQELETWLVGQARKSL